MHKPPLRTFLISGSRAFEACPLTHSVRRVEPAVQDIELSQPESIRSKMPKFPREIVERILDAIFVGYLESKELGDAVHLVFIDRSYAARANRLFVSGFPGIAMNEIIPSVSRTMLLLSVLYEQVFEWDLAFYINDSRAPFREWPVVNFSLPDLRKTVTPTHLVRTFSETLGQIYFRMPPEPEVVAFSDFANPPTLAWTGDRVCDAMAVDAEFDNGWYLAEKIRFPFLIISVETGECEMSDAWQSCLWQWKRFAELVKWACNGAELYFMHEDGTCYNVSKHVRK